MYVCMYVCMNDVCMCLCLYVYMDGCEYIISIYGDIS